MMVIEKKDDLKYPQERKSIQIYSANIRYSPFYQPSNCLQHAYPNISTRRRVLSRLQGGPRFPVRSGVLLQRTNSQPWHYRGGHFSQWGTETMGK